MNDRRTYLLIGLSLLLHLGILWLLPAPTFETEEPDEEQSLRVSLLDRNRPRRDEGARTPRQEDVRPEEEAVKDQSPEPESEREEAPDEGSGPTEKTPPEPPERKDVPPREKPTSKVQPVETPDQPDAERPDEPSPSDLQREKERADEQEPEYELLAGGPGSAPGQGIGSSFEADRRGSAAAGTVLAGEDVEKFEVVETFEAENRRGETVSIKVPDPESDSRGVVKAPAYTVSRALPDPSALGDTNDPTQGYRQPTLPSGGRKILRQPLPMVPNWLEETGEEVRVIVRYDIDRDGEVSSVEVVTSSGYPDLDARVVEKTGKWQFEPGPVSERRLAVFRFVLE